MIPIEAGPDTICACYHWFEEHEGSFCYGCSVINRANNPVNDEHFFEFWPAYNTPEEIADRGGDPDKWPQWVKDALNG